MCGCVLFGAWHKPTWTFSHVMRPWLVTVVTWKTNVSSYSKHTHTQSQKIPSIWKISLIILSFQRHHKVRNTRTDTHTQTEEHKTLRSSEIYQRMCLGKKKIFNNSTCFVNDSNCFCPEVSSSENRIGRRFRSVRKLIKTQSADWKANMVNFRHSVYNCVMSSK